MTGTYTSGLARLRRLGEFGPFFEGWHAMQIFGWSSKTTAHYLWMWSRQGHVRPLGGKSDVFFNLVADPKALDRVETAIRRVLPGAVVGAHHVLHAAGVTTQRPGNLQLLLRPDERKLSLEAAIIETRPAKWWTAIDAADAFDPGTEIALARLRIGGAIADAALAAAIDPDDIDFAAVPRAEVKRAAMILARLAHTSARTALQTLYRRVFEKARAGRLPGRGRGSFPGAPARADWTGTPRKGRASSISGTL